MDSNNWRAPNSEQSNTHPTTRSRDAGQGSSRGPSRPPHNTRSNEGRGRGGNRGRNVSTNQRSVPTKGSEWAKPWEKPQGTSTRSKPFRLYPRINERPVARPAVEIQFKIGIDYLQDGSNELRNDLNQLFHSCGCDDAPKITQTGNQYLCEFKSKSRQHGNEICQNLNIKLSRMNPKLKPLVNLQPIVKKQYEPVDMNKEYRDSKQLVDQAINSHKEKIERAKKDTDKTKPIEEQLAIADKLAEMQTQLDVFSNCSDKLLQLTISTKFTRCQLNNWKLELGSELDKLEIGLPIYARKLQILQMIRENSVSIITGATGCGKSSQIVQYLYYSGYFNQGMIVCTQPRKVAAISLAQHVSNEMGSNVGTLVGYRTGLMVKESPSTKISFMTDFSLIQWAKSDMFFNQASCILIDEAHERSLYTDLIIALSKKAIQSKNPNLKVVITSATINPDIFCKYFKDLHEVPVLNVSGRLFPIEVRFMPEGGDDTAGSINVDQKISQAISTAKNIHMKEPHGDILVFLPTPIQTENACTQLRMLLSESESATHPLVTMPLHGRQQANEQQKVFQGPMTMARRVVFATNAAETSVTIPGVRYVIDTGLAKIKIFEENRGLETLHTHYISKSSADQRKGRAGRMAPGVCIRLYSESEYNAMDPMTLPELLRTNLGQALLQLLNIGIAEPHLFTFVESPLPNVLEHAWHELLILGARNDDGITDIGRKISALPLQPRLGRLAVRGIEKGIGLDGLLLAAVATQSGSVWVTTSTEEHRMQLESFKIQFFTPNGDWITLLDLYKEWDKQDERRRRQWCSEHAINMKAMMAIRDVVKEGISVMFNEFKVKVPYKCHSTPEQIQELLCICYSFNLGLYSGCDKKGIIIGNRVPECTIFPQSGALRHFNTDIEWVIFESILETSNRYAILATPVPRETVLKLASENILTFDPIKLETLKLKRIKTFKMGKCALIKFVGEKWNKVKKLEEQIIEGNRNSIICCDVDIDGKQKIDLYSNDLCKETAEFVVTNAVDEIKAAIRLEQADCGFIGRSHDSICVVLAAGFSVSALLMPHEVRCLRLKNVPQHYAEEGESMIQEYLQNYGPVESIRFDYKNKNITENETYSYFGQVVYVNANDALKASTSINEFQLQPRYRSNELYGEFKITAKWPRAISRGCGIITLRSPIDLPKALRVLNGQQHDFGDLLGGLSLLSTSKFQIGQQKNPGEIFFHGFKGRPIKVLDREFRARLEDEGISVATVKVFSENKCLPTPEEMQMQKQLLKQKLEEICGSGHQFGIYMHQPKSQKQGMMANISLRNPADGYKITSGEINMPPLNEPIELEASVTARIIINRDSHKVIEKDLEEAISNLRSLKPDLNVKQIEYQNDKRILLISLQSKEPDSVAIGRLTINYAIEPCVIDIGSYNIRRQLKREEHHSFIEVVERDTSTYITLERHFSRISIFGSVTGKNQAKIKLDQYLNEFSSLGQCEIPLKTRSKGLLKLLVSEYGPTFSKLLEETGCEDMYYVYYKQSLLIVFKNESCYQKLCVKLNEIEQGINIDHHDRDCETCPVCFSNALSGEQTYHRVELCGHIYCTECINNLIENSLEQFKLPITCIEEGCSEYLTWSDVKIIFGKEKVAEKKREFGSRAALMLPRQNPELYSFCPTTGCDGVFRCTSGDEQGYPFQCPGCFQFICTTCKQEFHYGITCKMFKSSSLVDGTLENWLKEFPDTRRKCPKCKMGVEKIEGCNMMSCAWCHVRFCWLCPDKFYKNERECYAHLRSEHGNFV